MSTSTEPVPNERFFRLYAEHEVALHTFVRSLLPSREDAAEVMQEVMIALWRGAAEVADFRPWAFAVARNLTLMHLRRRKRDRHVFDDDLVQQLADDTVSLCAAHDRQREALDGCLEKLPTTLRDLVLAAYTKGTRMDELAVQRGQTAMSLYKVLHRIRQTLLECVQRTLAKEEPA